MSDREALMAGLQAEYRLAEAVAADERGRLAAARQRLEDARAAGQILQEAAEAAQQVAHAQIASVVSRCLKAVFGAGAYEFRVRFEPRRGKTDAVLEFVRGGAGLDPLDAAGGGVVDVAAFALRLACLVLAAPRRRRLLVLDEPFRHLSARYRPRVVELLKELSAEMGVQILMVTHADDLVAGRVVEVRGGQRIS